MKRYFLIPIAMLGCLACPAPAGAAVRYVNVSNTSPSPPYTDWAMAATTIQDAIDVAVAGDEIVVTNGIYHTGGRVVHRSLTNRVAVTKALTLRSVNGPEVTVIRGHQVPGTRNGLGAVRCVYLTNGASLVGFTLINGATLGDAFSYSPEDDNGGGAFCDEGVDVLNCVFRDNSACQRGGGSYRGNLNNCTLRGNSANWGGGASDCRLNNCTVISNSATYWGGGALDCRLDKCMVIGNVAINGGGTSYCRLNNCALIGNSAQHSGGGAYVGGLNNCTLTGNSASYSGGGAQGSFDHPPPGECCDEPQWIILNNCIVYHNTAPIGANHSEYTIMNNSCTTPPPTNGTGNINNAPLFVNEAAGNFRLQPTSPCINAGSSAYAPTGPDLDGNPRIAGGTVDMGAYEFSAAARYVDVKSTNPIPPYTTWATAATTIQDAIDVALASDEIVVADGIYETGERGMASGAPSTRVAVTKPLLVRSVNGPETTVIRGDQRSSAMDASGVRCVYLTHGAVLVGFTLTNGHTGFNFSGAGGVDWCPVFDGGGVKCEPTALVVNCVLTGNSAVCGGGAYGGTLNLCTITGNTADRTGGGSYGSTLNNCSLLNNTAGRYGGGAYFATLNNCGLTANRANGGGGAGRSALNDCTITGNAAAIYGGGAYFSTLTNCVLTGNSASSGGASSLSTLQGCTLIGNSAQYGGGAYGSTLNTCTLSGNTAQFGGGASISILNNCRLIHNSATQEGGGAWSFPPPPGNELPGCGGGGCEPYPECNPCLYLPNWFASLLSNCTLAGNSAQAGGGDAYSVLRNCIVYDNTAGNGLNCLGSWLSYSCTTPFPTNGVGNITDAPLFVNQAAGDFQLQSNSPCINAGRNANAPTGLDLDDNPRIVGGTVDIGAYEFQSPQSTLSYAWLQQYGLPADGSTEASDPDGDGHNSWQEWRAGTDPTSSLSLLRLLTPMAGTPGMIVRWQSVNGRTYFLERSTHLGAQPAFVPLASDIAGQPDMTAYADTNAVGSGPYFYRVGVRE